MNSLICFLFCLDRGGMWDDRFGGRMNVRDEGMVFEIIQFSEIFDSDTEIRFVTRMECMDSIK